MSLPTATERRVVTIGPGDSLDKAIALMEEHGIHHLPVVSEGHLLGMLSDRDILLSIGWTHSIDRQQPDGPTGSVFGPQTVQQVMSHPVIWIAADATLGTAAKMMLSGKISALPIMSGGTLVGIITETDVAQELLKHKGDGGTLNELLNGPVEHIMKARVTTVAPKTPVGEVIHLFRKLRIRHVPVTVDDAVLGVISDRDVRRSLGEASIRDMQAQAAGQFFMGPQTALDIMSRRVEGTRARASVREALELMVSEKIHCLPVIENGKLVGIVTETDMLRAAAGTDALQ